MIRIFRKSWMRSRRTVCAALCCVLLSSLLAVPAGAADYSGQFNLTFSTPDGYVNGYVNAPSNGGYQEVYLNRELTSSYYAYLRNGVIVPGVRLTGAFSAYFSYYYSVPSSSVSIVSPDLTGSDFYIQLENEDGVLTNLTGGIEARSFSPVPQDGYSFSRGYSFRIHSFVDDSIIDIARIRFRTSDSFSPARFEFSSTTPFQVACVFPSAVFILSDSASDIYALEEIADSIAAQSQIMSAMYADIISLLNDLYQRLGDMQAVEELTNTYFAQLIPLVNSINTNTANIYSLLQTQFQLLRTLIATESDDIQSAIEKQTDDLIVYFDTVFSGATGDMPEKSDDLETSVGDVSDAESNYQSNATQRFNELADAFTGFTGGTLGGVTLAATLFTRVWDTLGEYKIVYTWPLLLGLCLVILGRMSRLSGGQSSAEKRRGDSDA